MLQQTRQQRLAEAIRAGNPAGVTAALHDGADIEELISGKYPLVIAVEMGDIGVISALTGFAISKDQWTKASEAATNSDPATHATITSRAECAASLTR